MEQNNVFSPVKIFDENWQIFSKGELASESKWVQTFWLVEIPSPKTYVMRLIESESESE